MIRLAWAREVLNYLEDNEGLVDQLELAFADLQRTSFGIPSYGVIDDGVAPDCYLWTIHDHAILIRKGTEGRRPKLWIEAIRPLDSGPNE